jgi:hypothetical protein
MRDGRDLIGQGVAGAIYTHWRWPAKARVTLKRDWSALVETGTHELVHGHAAGGGRHAGAGAGEGDRAAGGHEIACLHCWPARSLPLSVVSFTIAVRGSSSCRAGDTVSGMGSERSLQIVDNALRLRRNPPPSRWVPGHAICSTHTREATCAARRRECRAERLQHRAQLGRPVLDRPHAPVRRALARLTDVAPIPGDEVPQASALGLASWDPPRAVDERRP